MFYTHYLFQLYRPKNFFAHTDDNSPQKRPFNRQNRQNRWPTYIFYILLQKNERHTTARRKPVRKAACIISPKGTIQNKKNMIRNYLLAALMLGATTSTALATDKGELNVLYLDGSSHVMKMTQVEKIELSGDCVNVVAKDGTTTHRISDISRIDLGDGTTAIANLKKDKACDIILHTEGYRITASGLADGSTLEVYAANGSLAARATARDGKATVNAGTLPGGVYLVKAAGQSLKMIKR